MAGPSRCAVVHWVRFNTEKSAADLDLTSRPKGCSSWKFGPDWAASSGSRRSASNVWCGVGLFDDLSDAETAFDQPNTYVPNLHEASAAWRALLLPIAHKGECNHLDAAEPGSMFDPWDEDPGGALFVMTTAGFNLRSKMDFQRLIDFRRRVDRMRPIINAADGHLAHQVFAPDTVADDGVTMSIWRDEKSMLSFAYRPGPHRDEVDRQRDQETVDRSSFTRFRVLRSAGQWDGDDPSLVPGQAMSTIGDDRRTS